MISLILMFISLVASPDSSCQFKEIDFPKFELRYQSGSVEVEAAAPDAKLAQCKPWKDFPELLVAEIDLGGAGTYNVTHETDLVVYKISGKKLNEVFRKTIKTETGTSNKKSNTTAEITVEKSYELEKTKKGEPSIKWSNSTKTDIIKLNGK